MELGLLQAMIGRRRLCSSPSSVLDAMTSKDANRYFVLEIPTYNHLQWRDFASNWMIVFFLYPC
ncbi:hypothetical protein Hdeb2414_s0014g00421671 [Helianthus debilis subsp. tardiflorus]